MVTVIMAHDDYDRPAKAGDLTAEEIEIAQWRIDVTEKGPKKIEEIYAKYWEAQPTKKYFAKKFKAAVEGDRLKNIVVIKHSDDEDFLSTDRQIQYDLK